MRDPYSVLGVSPSASADEIKKSYRKLSRMYHPDANINNPNKAMAEEKFKEVQEAYEQIMDERENGPRAQSNTRGYYGGSYGGASGSSSGSAYGGSYNNSYGGNHGQEYRRYRYAGRTEKMNIKDDDTTEVKGAIAFINSNMYEDALRVLNNVINYARDARWYYVRAHAYYGLGDVFKAKEDARTAAGLEPNNWEYEEYYRKLDKEDDIYRDMRTDYGHGCHVNSCCLELICMELLCNGCCIGSRYGSCLC